MATTTIFLAPRCPVCRKRSEVEMDIADLLDWTGGKMIQDVFPEMSKEDREVLISGTHPKCFNELFPPEEEEGE
jgi:hypothetical protein